MSDVVDPFAEEPKRQGPKQRPGPNDEPVEGIQYVGEEGDPEEVVPESLDAHLEEKVVDMPDVMMASDLLPDEDDPLAAIPVEPPDEETPPEEAVPPFLVQRNKYGPGAHGVYLADGMPVGVFLDRAHRELNGPQVETLLTEMGLDHDLAEWYGEQRHKRIAADAQLGEAPAVRKAMAQEAVRLAQKKAVQEAFIKAQKQKK